MLLKNCTCELNLRVKKKPIFFRQLPIIFATFAVHKT